ncbi:MAG: OsmC family peroxiredoxin [Chitinophagaceae bacterium]|nr:MAG: OsmC family peroxiredoxin [Chitinophagaceae bacterium]
MAKIFLERKKGAFGFDVKDEAGHLLQTDSSRENGGDESGFRPMQLVLAALGSCSAIDLVSILAKQRQDVRELAIEVDGEREKGTIPSLWKTVAVTFHVKGNIEAEKAEKAATLSMEKYCSVAETLRRGGTEITWKVVVEKTDLTS